MVRTQERRDGGGEEIQLHVGNKDLYGFNFHWLQSADIIARAQPTDLMTLERLEYGDAFVRPLALLSEGAAPLPASDPAFRSRLAAAVHRADETRAIALKKSKSTRLARSTAAWPNSSCDRANPSRARHAKRTRPACRRIMKHWPPRPANCAPP